MVPFNPRLHRVLRLHGKNKIVVVTSAVVPVACAAAAAAAVAVSTDSLFLRRFRSVFCRLVLSRRLGPWRVCVCCVLSLCVVTDARVFYFFCGRITQWLKR